MRYSNEEIACINLLAEHFQKGDIQTGVVKFQQSLKEIGITTDRLMAVLTVLKERGIIDNVTDTFEGRFTLFNITSRAVEVSREIAFLKKDRAERKLLLKMQLKREQEEREWRDAQRREDLRRAEQQRKDDLEWKSRQEAKASQQFFWQLIIVGVVATLVIAGSTLLGAWIQAKATRESASPPTMILK